ncbi:nitrate reductase molybdenum cofactor assembly chaperone [Cellulomonas sp. PhB143]|uniref:nitrate reductase molybdenum cofactor assembly chaperone n=1 Tax=Cellulomonas sp. PhB143 TaxID=2485186 RepID=UPI000F915CC5|nr:nitrate reductase molybdenum cofactor assembly chaperone [Cellulomonas sp. PhB143]ROS72122.1 respiratory nitrate reductase chaperone NarJ [Cellulomonas sp. PhB143]
MTPLGDAGRHQGLRSLQMLPRPTRRTPQLDALEPVRVTAEQRRATHMAASILLGYPDASVRGASGAVREVTAQLPVPVRTRLVAFLDALDAADAAALEALYVQTFDLKRRCAMYLSYYAAGDTRRRGMALVRFVQAYRAAGWELSGDELPDYLPTVLELSARCGDPRSDEGRVAAALLDAHREGIEVLRSALAALASPWTGVVEAVCLTLGPVDAATRERVLDLVTSGPPTEMVGLSALGPQEPGPLRPFTPGGTAAEEVRR